MSNIPAQLSALARNLIGKHYRHNLQSSAAAQTAGPVIHSELQTRSLVAAPYGSDFASTSHVSCAHGSTSDEQHYLQGMLLPPQPSYHSAGHANLNTYIAGGVTNSIRQLRSLSSDSNRQMPSSQLHAILLLQAAPQHARHISSTAIYHRSPEASQGLPNRNAAPADTKASFSHQMYQHPPMQNRDQLVWDKPDAQSAWQKPPQQGQRPPVQRSRPAFARQPGELRFALLAVRSHVLQICVTTSTCLTYFSSTLLISSMCTKILAPVSADLSMLFLPTQASMRTNVPLSYITQEVACSLSQQPHIPSTHLTGMLSQVHDRLNCSSSSSQ